MAVLGLLPDIAVDRGNAFSVGAEVYADLAVLIELDLRLIGDISTVECETLVNYVSKGESLGKFFYKYLTAYISRAEIPENKAVLNVLSRTEGKLYCYFGS